MRSFAQLFAGRTDVYGTYRLSGNIKASGKVEGRGTTHQKPLTDEVWEAHLSGKTMLGVVPIRLDGTVGWFAGDIDVYTLDHQELIRKVAALEIPVVVCKSKSGGAHLYCFVNGTISAADSIKLMREWVTKLGYPKCEVFPKQEWLNEESTGNWINLPYFGGDKAERYAFGLSGERLNLAQFQQMAEASSPTPADLAEMLKESGPKKVNGTKVEHSDAPPCVEKMFAERVTEGGRNNALTHIGIYFLKSDQDNWREKTMEANYKLFDDALPSDEVSQILKNVSKAKYEYLCNLEPMCGICDKEKCLTRKWGVGPQQGIDYNDCDIDRIIKINSDPPLYYVLINGTSVKMSTDQLLSPGKFRKRVYEITGELIAPVKERQHEARIQSVRIEVEAAPIEVNMEGQVIEAFEQWAEVHCPNSRSLDEIGRGNPFFDTERSVIYFKSSDLITAIKRTKKYNLADRDVWVALREFGAQPANVKVRGKQTKVWSYPVEKPWFELPDGDEF